MSSVDELLRLSEAGRIDIAPHGRLLEDPEPITDLDFARIEGMLLGIAIGDALGNTTESQIPQQRFLARGEIRGYLPSRFADDRSVGVPSDDSQMAFWTLEHLLEHGSLQPAALTELFASRPIFGIGGTVREALERFRAGASWDTCGVSGGAGNGALMRIAPVLIPHLKTGGSRGLWADTAIATMVTHNSSAAIGASVAWVDALWRLLSLEAAPEPEWWLSTVIGSLRSVESESLYAPRFGKYVERPPGLLSAYTEMVITEALDRDLSVRDACDTWGSGAYLLETLPSVLYVLMRHGHDAEEAIVRAVNDTKDNDTVAAIVGAAVGALHGSEALPQAWVQRLLGRTQASDDGRVFELIEQTRGLLT